MLFMINKWYNNARGEFYERKRLKSIERYFNKFNEDAASFNEFEANDFIKLLKNNGRNDDAIEVGNTFLQMAHFFKRILLINMDMLYIISLLILMMKKSKKKKVYSLISLKIF